MYSVRGLRVLPCLLSAFLACRGPPRRGARSGRPPGRHRRRPARARPRGDAQGGQARRGARHAPPRRRGADPGDAGRRQDDRDGLPGQGADRGGAAGRHRGEAARAVHRRLAAGRGVQGRGLRGRPGRRRLGAAAQARRPGGRRDGPPGGGAVRLLEGAQGAQAAERRARHPARRAGRSRRHGVLRRPLPGERVRGLPLRRAAGQPGAGEPRAFRPARRHGEGEAEDPQADRPRAAQGAAARGRARRPRPVGHLALVAAAQRPGQAVPRRPHLRAAEVHAGGDLERPRRGADRPREDRPRAGGVRLPGRADPTADRLPGPEGHGREGGGPLLSPQRHRDHGDPAPASRAG